MTPSNSTTTTGIVADRLPACSYEKNFADLRPPVSPHEAAVAAVRRYDAPCPTPIDIPRFGAICGPERHVAGLNNIELISDRPLELNLREIKAVKQDYPDRAVVASVTVPCEETDWWRIAGQVEETGADGIELKFGCPHGMQERGMGSAVGQVAE